MFMENENFEAEYYKGWLIVTDKATRKASPVQLIDSRTRRNITLNQFREGVKKFGLDRACQSFKKLEARL